MDGRSPTVSNLTSSKRKRPAVRLGVFITLSEDFSVTSKILSLLLRSGLGNGSMISVSPKPDAQCLLQVDLRNETVAERHGCAIDAHRLGGDIVPMIGIFDVRASKMTDGRGACRIDEEARQLLSEIVDVARSKRYAV